MPHHKWSIIDVWEQCFQIFAVLMHLTYPAIQTGLKCKGTYWTVRWKSNSGFLILPSCSSHLQSDQWISEYNIIWLVCLRSTASCNSAQAQLQSLRDSITRLTAERDTLKKDLEIKNNDILEKTKTITQVKKIGRRYKSQYEELKSQYDKVRLSWKYIWVWGGEVS